MRIAKLGEKIRGARLQWYGHVKRREVEYVGRRTLEMEVPGSCQYMIRQVFCNMALSC